MLRAALKKMGRQDLIGNGKMHLIPPVPVQQAARSQGRYGKIKQSKAHGRQRRGRAQARSPHQAYAATLGTVGLRLAS
jgi:hypothetical protein